MFYGSSIAAGKVFNEFRDMIWLVRTNSYQSSFRKTTIIVSCNIHELLRCRYPDRDPALLHSRAGRVPKVTGLRRYSILRRAWFFSLMMFAGKQHVGDFSRNHGGSAWSFYKKFRRQHGHRSFVKADSQYHCWFFLFVQNSRPTGWSVECVGAMEQWARCGCAEFSRVIAGF